jgi:hypothetical protein
MSDKSQQEENRETKVIRPFEKRFDIPLALEDVKERFMQRIWNGLNQNFETLVRDGPSIYDLSVLRHVADGLGVMYHAHYGFAHYAGEYFYELLHSLELLYAGMLEDSIYNRSDDLQNLESIINAAVDKCEIDLGIEWKDGIFRPSGAKLLDKELVNEPMKWLADPKYKNVLQPFQKGLKHYVEATKDQNKLSDTVTDMYEALEALAKIVTERPDKDLSANAQLFASKLGLNEYYNKMLKDYIGYACDYRHGVEQTRERQLPKRNEVEAFLYTTGLFIRLAIQQLNTK